MGADVLPDPTGRTEEEAVEPWGLRPSTAWEELDAGPGGGRRSAIWSASEF